ncbi:MAG: ATP synthase F1 subunit delta [Phycisphaerae bacterium]|nr:ATP synthase F1 subunit delta [Phycisphaerae bacterium]
MSQSRRYIVREIYSEVLFDLAEQGGDINTVQEELAVVRQIFRHEPEFAALLSSEVIKGEEKIAVIRRVFEGRLSELTIHFLGVLARRGRMGFLAGISDRFETLADEYHHRQPVEVTVAKQPDAAFIEKLKADLATALNSEVKLSVKVDPGLIGGVVIRKDDVMIDSSVRSSLEHAVKTIVNTMKEKERNKAAR